MARDLFYFDHATSRVEGIANELGDIAKTAFNAAAARRDAEQRLAYMVQPGTPEGNAALDAEVRRMQGESERALEQRGAALVTELSQVESTITTTYEAVRPKRDISDPAAILLSRERWDAAQALLESGRDLQTVVETADVPTVLAIEAFAPDYLWAQAAKELGAKAEGDHAAAIRRDVETLTRKRLTVIAAEADRVVLKAAYRAQGFLDVAWVWVRHLLNRFQGVATEALTAALEVKQIRQTYGIDQTREQQRTAVNDAVSTAESAHFRFVERWTSRVPAVS